MGAEFIRVALADPNRAPAVPKPRMVAVEQCRVAETTAHCSAGAGIGQVVAAIGRLVWKDGLCRTGIAKPHHANAPSRRGGEVVVSVFRRDFPLRLAYLIGGGRILLTTSDWQLLNPVGGVGFAPLCRCFYPDGR